MITNRRSLTTIPALLVGICTLSASADSVTAPSDTLLFPPCGTGASSFDLSFAQGADNSVPIRLRFDGSIENSSFLNGAQISFWFDWTDFGGTAHTSDPEPFSLTPILGVLTSHSSEYFRREFTIGYSPAEASVHFVNETAGSLDGKPVLVAGTLSTVPEPTGITLVVGAALIVPPYRRLSQAAARKKFPAIQR